MERRRLPDSLLELSVIGYAPSLGPEGARSVRSEGARREWAIARQLGVTWVDAIDHPNPREILAEPTEGPSGPRPLVLRRWDPELEIDRGPRTPEPEPGELPFLADPPPALWREPEPLSGLRELARRTSEGIWGVAWSDLQIAIDWAPAALRSGARLIRAPMSLLRREEALALASLAHAGGAAVIATDPFDGGRLDGSLLEASTLTADPRRAPTSLSELTERFAPVAALRWRPTPEASTLVEAALRFPLGLDGVVAVAAPIELPSHLEALRAFAGVARAAARARGPAPSPTSAGDDDRHDHEGE